jgi:hypothetical protein
MYIRICICNVCDIVGGVYICSIGIYVCIYGGICVCNMYVLCVYLYICVYVCIYVYICV